MLEFYKNYRLEAYLFLNYTLVKVCYLCTTHQERRRDRPDDVLATHFWRITFGYHQKAGCQFLLEARAIARKSFQGR